MIAEAPDDFELYSGDDGLTLPLLAVGAVGVIGVSTHWAAADGRDDRRVQKGDVARARELNASLIESYASRPATQAQTRSGQGDLRVLGQPSGPAGRRSARA